MRRGAIISVVLHVLVLALLLIGIPFWKTPEEPPPDDTVAMVFDSAAATSMSGQTSAPADTPDPNPAPPAPEPSKPQPEEPSPPPPPPPQPPPQPPPPAPPPPPEPVPPPPTPSPEPLPAPPPPPPPPQAPPPPPVQQAETPPPTPASAPMPVPPLPKPLAQVRPPPQRAAARATVKPSGAAAHAAAGPGAGSHAGDANNGAAWMGKLKQWWDEHSFYPKEASQTNEGGSVKVHIVIAADGQVMSVEVVQSSGVSVLDAAAVAVYRNARLPPFPPGVPAQPADVVVTLHYRPADGG
jgi:protein TonB